MDKSLILNRLKKHFNFKNDFEFAEFLGIEQNTLSSWKKRNTLNYDTIISKCTDIKSLLILTGKEEEFKFLLNSEKTTFKEELNSYELELLKKDLDNARITLEHQKDIIDLRKVVNDNLNKEVEKLKSEIELLKGKE